MMVHAVIRWMPATVHNRKNVRFIRDHFLPETSLHRSDFLVEPFQFIQ
jgi:hypothetical protein